MSSMLTNPSVGDFNIFDRWGDVVGLAPAAINYEADDTGGVTVLGGSGGNTVTVDDTSSASTTTLETGTGADTVFVLGSTTPLNVNNPGGQDNVYLGSTLSNFGEGNVFELHGTVDVFGAGGTYLYVDQGGDNAPTTWTMNNGSITGVAPTAIAWTP